MIFNVVSMTKLASRIGQLEKVQLLLESEYCAHLEYSTATLIVSMENVAEHKVTIGSKYQLKNWEPLT